MDDELVRGAAYFLLFLLAIFSVDEPVHFRLYHRRTRSRQSFWTFEPLFSGFNLMRSRLNANCELGFNGRFNDFLTDFSVQPPESRTCFLLCYDGEQQPRSGNE